MPTAADAPIATVEGFPTVGGGTPTDAIGPGAVVPPGCAAPGASTPLDPLNPMVPATPSGPSASADPAPSATPDGFEPNIDGEPIYARLVRLTHPQWENSVRDLLQLGERSGLSDSFEGDPPRGKFDNNERALEVTSTLWGDYQRASETLAEQVSADAAARERVMQGRSEQDFIREFGRAVFRRPLSPDEETTYQALFASATTYFPDSDATTAGFRLTVEAMLQSPAFLYRSELGADGEALDAYEVASKLSFLLRNTTPSDELLDAAENGELTTIESVESWAVQMLDEATALEVIASYNGTLLGTNRFESISKDTTVYPTFTAEVALDMKAEADTFLEYLFSEGLGVRELLTSTVGFVTPRTAAFYGEDAPLGAGLTQVDLGPERPGFFTRLAFLAFNGNNAQSDPIHRGVDLSLRMMCISLSAPPGELPSLPAQEDDQTNRERVVAATEIEGTPCVTCHKTLINPLGFAFEGYDAVGQARSMDNGQPVDTQAEYQFSDGLKPFDGPVELMDLFVQSEQVHSCQAQNLAEFTLGRDLADGDGSLVARLADDSLNQSGSIKGLMLSTITSDAFLKRTGVDQ